jgi:galactokinase
MGAPTTSDLFKTFVQLFGTRPHFVQAPGRVNLIGEHTDYNGGFVLPTAIQFHTTVGYASRKDKQLVVYSENYAEQVEFSLGQLPSAPGHHWSDYVLGVAHKLLERGIPLSGANLLIYGDVPQGAGLSSSASLEVAVCQAFLQLADRELDGNDMALLCQRAENEFVGARCGIMDQFVAVHGRKDHALLLDCRSLTYRHQPIPPEVRLVLCNTMVRHSVAGGEYNQRRRECETAVTFFSKFSPQVATLRDVTLDEFEHHQAHLPETVRKRCRHVITENVRALQAADCLAKNDLSRFGRLMRESHASLRDDFQVSCRELDVLVELASRIDGVYGARMTGGGFGGCTINLVRADTVDWFHAQVSQGYQRAMGQHPEIYVCVAADGVSCIERAQA